MHAHYITVEFNAIVEKNEKQLCTSIYWPVICMKMKKKMFAQIPKQIFFRKAMNYKQRASIHFSCVFFSSVMKNKCDSMEMIIRTIENGNMYNKLFIDFI